MKINVAVHIPLFNILSVRQTYCLSIVVAAGWGWGGGDHRLCPPPRSVWDTYDGPASAHSAMAGSTQVRTLHICSTKARCGGTSFHRFYFSSSRFTHVRTTNVSKRANGILLFGTATNQKSILHWVPLKEKNKNSDIGSRESKRVLITGAFETNPHPCNLLRVFWCINHFTFAQIMKDGVISNSERMPTLACGVVITVTVLHLEGVPLCRTLAKAKITWITIIQIDSN